MKVLTKQVVITILALLFLQPSTFILAEEWPATYFVPMTGCRLFDTRASVIGGQMRPLCQQNESFCTAIRSYYIFDGGAKISDQGGSADCVVPRHAIAVHMSLKVVDIMGQGWLRTWHYDGDSRGSPRATILGWAKNEETTAVPLLVNPLSGSFNVNFRFYMENETASLDFVGDVLGYYVPIELVKSF